MVDTKLQQHQLPPHLNRHPSHSGRHPAMASRDDGTGDNAGRKLFTFISEPRNHNDKTATNTVYATEGAWKVRVETLINLVEKPISGEWGSEGKGIKVIRSTNFTNEGVLNLDNVIERDIPQKKIESKLIKEEHSAFEKSGGSPNQPVGRVVFFDCDDRYLFSNFTSVLRPKAKVVNSKYLHYILFATHKMELPTYYLM